MRTLILAALTLPMTTVSLTAQSSATPPSPAPPVARVQPKVDTLNGEVRVDNYFWLREKQNPEVMAYLEAENAYTAAGMRHTEALQERIYHELLGRIKETDLSVPYRQGGFWYYTRTEQGKAYPIYCRRPGTLDAPEQVILDQNALAQPQRRPAALPRGHHRFPRLHAVREGPRHRPDHRRDPQRVERHRLGG